MKSIAAFAGLIAVGCQAVSLNSDLDTVVDTQMDQISALADMDVIQVVEEPVDEIMEALAEEQEEEEDDTVSVEIPEAKEGCTLTMSIDVEEGNINFVNVPTEIVEAVSEAKDDDDVDSDDEEEE